MEKERHLGFYLTVILLLTVILINIFILIAYAELPSSIAKETKQKPLYQDQTIPEVSDFSKIIENLRFQQMKLYPFLKGEPKGKANPFAPFVITE